MMKKLQTSQMQALVEFVESGSLEKAAKKLHITQPALSVQIRKIEAEFEHPLFEVLGRRKVLTPYGLMIFETSKSLMKEIDLAFERVDRLLNQPEKQTIRVAGRREVFHFFSSRINPVCRIQLVPSSSEDAVKKLLHHEVDIAISRITPQLPGIKSEKLLSNKTHLVCHERHLAAYKRTRIAENTEFLKKTPVILYDFSAPLLSSWLQKFHLKLEDLNIKYVCEDWLSILDLIESGEGYSILPNSLNPSSQAVRSFELEDKIMPSHVYSLVYRKSSLDLPLFRSLLSPKKME